MENQEKGRRSQSQYAWIAILFFSIALGSRSLFNFLPPPSGTILWISFWVVVCFLGIITTYRTNFRSTLQEIRLSSPFMQGFGISLLASLPMLVIFVFNLDFNQGISTLSIFLTSILAPFTEEFLFRGYFFLQVYHRAGWSFILSVIVSAGVFGIAHYNTLAGSTNMTDILAEIGIISLGGVFYAWLLIRWDNLWVPIFMHAFMNLWCEGFACDQIVPQTSTNIGRLLAVFLAITITLLWKRKTPALV